MTEKSAAEWLELARPGLDYYGFVESDVDKTIECLSRAAELGSVEACLFLGRHLHLNHEHDDSNSGIQRARELLKTAADLGCARSMQLLCCNHQSFVDEAFQVSADELMATTFQRLEMQAAENKEPDAMYLVAWWRDCGWGCEVDETQAALDFRLAAESGSVAAMTAVADGLLCLEEPDYDEAIRWAQKAIEYGDRSATWYWRIMAKSKMLEMDVPCRTVDGNRSGSRSKLLNKVISRL